MPRAVFRVLYVVAFCTPAVQGQQIYWAQGNGVHRCALDGSAVETVVDTGFITQPTHLTVDLQSDRVYWTELGQVGYVRRATLSGLAQESLAVVLNDFPFGIDLDASQGHVYWGLFGPNDGIVRANLDGSNPITLNGASVGGLTLDLVNARIYYTEASDTGGGIRRTNLDGSNDVELLPGGNQHHDVALDVAAGQMYYTVGKTIGRANLTGTNALPLITTSGDTRGLALDLANGHVYWTEAGWPGVSPNRIRRANLDGSNVVDVLNIGTSPMGIALDLRECSGHGSADSGTCECDSGWSGANCGCSEAACPNDCSNNGSCDCSLCVCDAGWSGSDCSCSTECPADCSGNGSCDCGTCVCEPGWSGPDCGCSTDDCPNNCSNQGTCVCGACQCDSGWDGPDCSCVEVSCPNDCSGNGDCSCGECICDQGWAGTDCSAFGTTRTFMAKDGWQDRVATTGTTRISMDPGATQRILLWLKDSTLPGDSLGGYQIIMPDSAEAQAGAVGSVTYVDNDAGQGQGDSVYIEIEREDWVFAEHPIAVPPAYNETPGGGFFGLIGFALVTENTDPAALGRTHYLAEFEVQASFDAAGAFKLAFRIAAPDPPPLSGFFTPVGSEFIIGEFQTLRILVCDCNDDNVCTYDQCGEGQVCSNTPNLYGDVDHDGDVDIDDVICALDVVQGNPTECTIEDVDIAGCAGNGVADMNDVLAIQDAFNCIDPCCGGSGCE